MACPPRNWPETATSRPNGDTAELAHGAVVIAAITSCTNTSNPFVMVGAGLLAKKAVEKGLQVKPYVKTSLAPGSRVVTDYLEKAGLIEPLAQLGFRPGRLRLHHLHRQLRPAARRGRARPSTQSNLVAAAVLSGNRNFEGPRPPHTCRPTTWPRRRWWWPTPWPARSTST